MNPGDHQPLNFDTWEPALHWIGWVLFVIFAVLMIAPLL